VTSCFKLKTLIIIYYLHVGKNRVLHLFLNRLPTKTNLFRRGIVQHDAQMCVSGCGLVESDAHLFLNRDIFGQVWQLVRHWLGVSSVDPATVVDHFHQFSTSSGLAKSRCSFMHLIWFASSWVIWKESNAIIFREKESTTYQLLENIKLLSFWWFKVILFFFMIGAITHFFVW